METRESNQINITNESKLNLVCKVCGFKSESREEVGFIRGNTERFKDQLFVLWKCSRCRSIHSVDPVDYKEIYSDYPLNKRSLDIFARGTLNNVLSRLKKAGLKKTDSILDYGCGNGVFIQFLKEKGYARITGYDPYVPEFAKKPEGPFDCVVANDVIEHVEDPRALVRDCVGLTKGGGLLYIGTADSDGVDMHRLTPHIMRLHQPFHRVIINQKTLLALVKEFPIEIVASYKKSYMDTLRPFSNYRFLDELSKALQHNMDAMLRPSSAWALLRHPRLFWYGLFGYFFPSAHEPAVIVRKNENRGQVAT